MQLAGFLFLRRKIEDALTSIVLYKFFHTVFMQYDLFTRQPLTFSLQKPANYRCALGRV